MREKEITKACNKCVDILNKSDLSRSELIASLAQLLIYSGKSIANKTIDIHDMDINELYKEYYANNDDNDIGLGLILNGASIMGTLSDVKLEGNVTATKENHYGDQVPSTTEISQEVSSTANRPQPTKGRGSNKRKSKS